MFYYLYKITNRITGKLYIGVHKTDDLDDGYMGSGTYLKRAQEKYGVENFLKEILQQFDSAEKMFEAESKVVNEEFVADPNTYNIRLGGFGGWAHITKDQRKEYSSRGREKIKWLLLNDEEYRSLFHEKRSMIAKELHRKGVLPGWPSWSGKTHSEESRKKIGLKSAERNSGTSHPNFGKRWIHNKELQIDKMVDLKELDLYISSGWERRRLK